MKSKILFLVSLVLLPLTGCDIDSSSLSSDFSSSSSSIPGSFTFGGHTYYPDSYDDIASIELKSPGALEEIKKLNVNEIEPIIDNQYYENMVYSFKFVFKDANDENLFINFTRDNFTYDSEHVEVHTYYESFSSDYYMSTPYYMIKNHSFYISMKKPIYYTEIKFEAGDISFIIPISILEVSYDTNRISFIPSTDASPVDCNGYCYENFDGVCQPFIKIFDNYEDYNGTDKSEQFFINFSLVYVYAGTSLFNLPKYDTAFVSYNNRLNLNFYCYLSEDITSSTFDLKHHYLFKFSIPKQYLELPISVNHMPRL